MKKKPTHNKMYKTQLVSAKLKVRLYLQAPPNLRFGINENKKCKCQIADLAQ